MLAHAIEKQRKRLFKITAEDYSLLEFEDNFEDTRMAASALLQRFFKVKALVLFALSGVLKIHNNIVRRLFSCRCSLSIKIENASF